MSKYLDENGVSRLWAKTTAKLNGDSAPTEQTAGRIGDLYTTADGAAYRCVSASNGSYGWEKMLTAEMLTVTVPLDWQEDSVNGGYCQSVPLDSISENDNPIADIILGDDIDANSLYLDAWALITRITTTDGSITLWANSEAPQSAFSIMLKVVK